MTFDEWWTETMGAPPDGAEEGAVFQLAYLSWRAALTRGEWDPPASGVEHALQRVGNGECTYEDELLLRRRIQVGVATVLALERQIATYDDVRAQMQQEEERASAYMPQGGKPMGGTRWRCPRCNFIAGLKRVESTCRGCGYPGDDTRGWNDDDGKEG